MFEEYNYTLLSAITESTLSPIKSFYYFGIEKFSGNFGEKKPGKKYSSCWKCQALCPDTLYSLF